MAILKFLLDTVGQVGVNPRIIYLDTNNTIAQVQAVGYLNKFVLSGNKVKQTDMALVVTRATPSSKTPQANFYDVSFSAGNWTLTLNSAMSLLPNGQIFVGNASGIAAPVAMTGVVAITNAGVTSLTAGSVLLASLASGITPSSVVKYDGKVTNAGGSATFTIPVTGALATDRAFVAIEASTNAVSVQKALPGLNTINVALSGDPGAATVVSYQLLRTAS